MLTYLKHPVLRSFYNLNNKERLADLNITVANHIGTLEIKPIV